MDILNKNQKIILIIIVAFILLFIGYYIIRKSNHSKYINLETELEENNNESEEIEIIDKDEKENKEIVIHITGAVKKQGIVKVKQGSRIADVIESAGGVTKDTDLSKINLAYVVEDGQKIYVPNINDKNIEIGITEEAGDGVVEENTEKKTEKVNINKASQTELETLNGVGPSTALKIINYRNENGNFKSIEDIKNVPGIGDAKFESLKNEICVK